MWSDRSDGYLYLFGALFADQHFKFVANMAHDICIEFVAGDAHVARVDKPAHAHDPDIRGTSADIYHHVPRRFMDRQFDADRGREWLFYHVHFACAGSACGVAHGAYFDRSDSRRHADHHARTEQCFVSRLRFIDEIREHLRCHLEIRYDTIYDRFQCLNMLGCTPHHVLGLLTDGDHLARFCIECDDRGLIDDDAAAAHIHQRIGRAEVYADVVGEEPQYLIFPPAQTIHDSFTQCLDNLALGHDVRLAVASSRNFHPALRDCLFGDDDTGRDPY